MLKRGIGWWGGLESSGVGYWAERSGDLGLSNLLRILKRCTNIAFYSFYHNTIYDEYIYTILCNAIDLYDVA